MKRNRLAVLKKLISVICGSACIFASAVPVSADDAWAFTVQWDDDDNALGLRPEKIAYEVQDDGHVNTIYAGEITAEENWAQSLQASSGWNLDNTVVEPVDHYASVVQADKETHTYAIRMSSVYAGAVSSVHVVILWNDNNNAAGARPSSFTLALTGQDGTKKTQDISSSAATAEVDGIPFLCSGDVNRVTPSISGMDGYTASASTIASNRLRTVYIYADYNGSRSRYLKDGYQEVEYDGAKMHIYKASGKEKIGMLAVPYDKGTDTYTPVDIQEFAKASNIKINAVVNSSYFNNNPDDAKYGYIYGRFQGFTTDGGTMNNTPDTASQAEKGQLCYMDLVIDKDGIAHAGTMHSWEYNDAGGFPSQIMAGAAPAGVEINDGLVVVNNKWPAGWYSSATGYAKVTNKNSQTAVMRCDDGEYALIAVEGSPGTGLAPAYGLTQFARSNSAWELSVYDSGGSTQMGYRNAGGTMSYPVYSGRKIPSVWIIYEDLNDAEPEEKTIAIHFKDISGDAASQKYLDGLQITVSTKEGTAVSTGIESVISELQQKHYIVDTTSYPSTVDGTVEEYTVNVCHGTDKISPSDQEVSYTRTIHYVDEDGKQLAEDTVQTVNAVQKAEGYKDLVTGVQHGPYSWVAFGENAAWPEAKVPAIDGYEADQDVIPSVDLSKQTHPEDQDITVTYKELPLTITLNYGYEGSTPDEIEVNKGDALGSALTIPEREGFEFLGWFTDPEAGDEATAETVPEESTTYYAHWEELNPQASPSSSASAVPSASPSASSSASAEPGTTPSASPSSSASAVPSASPSASSSASAEPGTAPSASASSSASASPSPDVSQESSRWHLKVSGTVNSEQTELIDKDAAGEVNLIITSEDGKTVVKTETLSKDSEIALSYDVPEGMYISAWNRTGDDENIIFTPVLSKASGTRTITVYDLDGKTVITTLKSNAPVEITAGTNYMFFAEEHPAEDTEEQITAGINPTDGGKEIEKWDVQKEEKDGREVLMIQPVYKGQKTIEVIYTDTDEKTPQDLSGYSTQVSRDSVSEKAASDARELENAHYVVGTVPEVTEDTSSVVIPVSHQMSTTTAEKTGNVTRNINYVFDGNPSRNYTIAQTSTTTTTVTSTADQVTKQVMDTEEKLTYAEPFAEVETPYESGWKADQASVPQADVLTSPDTPLNVTVTYRRTGLISRIFGASSSTTGSSSAEIKAGPSAGALASPAAPVKTAAPLVSKEDSSEDISPLVYACIGGIAAAIVILAHVLHKRLKDEKEDL